MGREWEMKKKYPPFLDGNGKVKNFPAVWDRKGKSPPKNPVVWEREKHAFLLGKKSGTGIPAHAVSSIKCIVCTMQCAVCSMKCVVCR